MAESEANEMLPPESGVEVEEAKRKTSSQRFKQNRKIAFAVAVAIAVLGIIFFIIGLVLIVKSRSKGEKSSEIQGDENSDAHDKCAFSAEAKRAGLPEFFKKVDKSYYELLPCEAGKMRGVPMEYVKKLFQPYNPTPKSIKAISERSQKLWKELNGMKIDRTQLLAREQRMIAKADHFLKHYFGRPFENNYLAGYWMFGPGSYCRRTFKGITSIDVHLATALRLFRPKTAVELEDALAFLGKFKIGINQFKANLKDGIRAGMVGSVTVCEAGKQCLENKYPQIASQRSGRGVLEWSGVSVFLSEMLPDESAKITVKHGKNASILVQESLIANVGSPLLDLFVYLESNHIPHCVPNNVSSGLGTLPLDHVYYNGSRTLKRTNKTLRGGESIISGKESYRNFMSLFTTQGITPDEVNNIGWKMLDDLYRQAVVIAKQITKKENQDEAVHEFRKHLNSSAMYFNEHPFPENESNAEAFFKCRNVKDAQVYCPERYKTMMKWQDLARNTIARIRPKLTSLFYFTGNKTTVPTCPVSMAIRFQPLFSVQSYRTTTSSCKGPALYLLPFFVDRMGPKFLEVAVSAHEANPGHHTQLQGYSEHFWDHCLAGVDFDFLRSSYVTAFGEGWALYAENPLAAQDADLYQDRPLESYGFIKSQIWRALRLIIDTGFHSSNMTRDQALNLFDRYLWDNSDVVAKEVSRYQSWPGQATAYMTGQLAIWRMRNETLAKLGAKFKLQDYHYHILSHGSVPITFLETRIKEYAECVLDEGKKGCKDFLSSHIKQEYYSEEKFEEESSNNKLNKLLQGLEEEEFTYLF